MATNFETFYGPLRSLLGDRKVGALFLYPDDVLDSGLRTVFAMGKQPTGFSLEDTAGAGVTSANLADACQVTPDVALGDPFATICLWAAKLMIAGEDGALRYATRSLSVTDKGDRKRDLLAELEVRLNDVETEFSFGTVQSFASWVLAGAEPAEFVEE